VRNVFEEEEEVEKEEEDSNALSWVLCAAANKDEGQEGGTKEKRKNVHKTNSRGRSTMLFNCKICLLELSAKESQGSLAMPPESLHLSFICHSFTWQIRVAEHPM
jgi:hypothetical protein